MNTNTIATTVSFTAADGVDIELHASRPSKDDAIKLGWLYAETATQKESGLDDLLDTFGPVLIRRSLQAFANYSKRNAEFGKDVAAFAMTLRDEIKVVHAAKAA